MSKCLSNSDLFSQEIVQVAFTEIENVCHLYRIIEPQHLEVNDTQDKHKTKWGMTLFFLSFFQFLNQNALS